MPPFPMGKRVRNVKDRKNDLFSKKALAAPVLPPYHQGNGGSCPRCPRASGALGESAHRRSQTMPVSQKEKRRNSQIAHSVPVICHLGPIMSHSASVLFSLELNSTGRQGVIDVLFQKKVTLTIIMCSNPYYVDIN